MFTRVLAWGRCGGTQPPHEGVAVYFAKAETCRDTSLLSQNNRVGGAVPKNKKSLHEEGKIAGEGFEPTTFGL